MGFQLQVVTETGKGYITYLESNQDAHYSPLVADVFSRKIMGYDLSIERKASDTVKALKQEFLLYRCNSFSDLKRLVAESINIYNKDRPHLNPGMQTPEVVHKTYGLPRC